MKEWGIDPDAWWRLSIGARGVMISYIKNRGRIEWAMRPKDSNA